MVRLKLIIFLDVWNSNNLFKNYWIQLIAYDSWDYKILSNKFSVTISPFFPPAITDKINQINVYNNYFTEVVIPRNLFYSTYKNLDLYSTSWIDNSNIRIATKIFTNNQTNESSLYVKVYGDTGWNITIVDRNSYCQSSEVVVSINVIGWASKECTQCKGPTDSDWLQCKQGYVLDNSGSCLVDVSYIPTTNYNLFMVWGIISMVTWLIQTLLSFIYDKDSLELVSHLQTVIMLTLSFDSTSPPWIEYLSWIQMFKFDFEFVNQLLNIKFPWTRSSEKLINAKLYWEEILYNYFAIFWFIFIILLANIILIFSNKCKNILNSKFVNKIKMNLFWIFLTLVLPFMIINIWVDLIGIQHHILSSLFTICLLILCWLYWIITKWYFAKLEFIYKIDPFKNPKYFYSQIILKCLWIIIFLIYKIVLKT